MFWLGMQNLNQICIHTSRSQKKGFHILKTILQNLNLQRQRKTVEMFQINGDSRGWPWQVNTIFDSIRDLVRCGGLGGDFYLKSNWFNWQNWNMSSRWAKSPCSILYLLPLIIVLKSHKRNLFKKEMMERGMMIVTSSLKSHKNIACMFVCVDVSTTRGRAKKEANEVTC